MFKFPRHMKRVFKDEALQNEFEEIGYVRIPFYNQEEIKELKNLFYRFNKKENVTGFYPSTFSSDLEYRSIADKEIRRIGSRSINRVLMDHKVVCGSFIVKGPDKDSGMSVHQDMTLVDESEFTGVNMWCPLLDLTENNGPIMVLDKSNRIYPSYRGSSIPTIYKNVHEDILKLMKPVYLKAGEAAFFDQSIIHYSPPNFSDEPRIATNTYFSHKDARFVIAYHNPEQPDKIELFQQDDSFMTNYEQFGNNITNRPNIGKRLGFFDYDFPQITREDLSRLYGLKIDAKDYKSKGKKGFLRSLFSKIKNN